MDQTCGGMEDAPTGGPSVGPVEAQELELADETSSQGDGRHPGGVGLEAGEVEPGETGVLQPADVLFDVSVSPQGDVEVPGVTVLVGRVAPLAVVESGEETPLGSGVEGLTSDDELASPWRAARRGPRRPSHRIPRPRERCCYRSPWKCLLFGSLCVSTTTGSLTGRASPRRRQLRLNRRREELGLNERDQPAPDGVPRGQAQ